MLTFNNVSYCYLSKSSGLKNINFSLEKGEFVFITGPSSHYKTTILNLIYGIVLPQEGNIKIFDIILPADKKKIPLLRKKIGYIFSPPLFFERLTVEDNLKITLLIKSDGNFKDSLEERISKVLSYFPEVKRDIEVYKLSTTLKEKLNVLRGIISRPPLLLADDPFKNFGKDDISRIMDIFSEENNSGTTILVASSNKELALNSKRRVIEIKGGKIVDES